MSLLKRVHELLMEDMKMNLIELAKANEELVKKNMELLGKLKKADSQIIELEKERRADKNQIKVLTIQLYKAVKHAQKKQIICVTKEKEEEEDKSKPVEEEEYNCRDNMEDHSCREEQPGTEEVRVEIKTSLKNKGQQAKGLKKYVKKTKQIVETHSIEINVKLCKRGAEKRKEEEWEYHTPEGLKPAKRTKKEKQTVKNDILIDGVNCNTNTWKLLDEKVTNHYKNWFDLNKDKNDE
ncbi:hypothetical protein ACLB2K_006937 [Fragaria x ananassa]